jgi:glycosyltransferase involved in cell wall biosynthesis
VEETQPRTSLHCLTSDYPHVGGVATSIQEMAKVAEGRPDVDLVVVAGCDDQSRLVRLFTNGVARVLAKASGELAQVWQWCARGVVVSARLTRASRRGVVLPVVCHDAVALVATRAALRVRRAGPVPIRLMVHGYLAREAVSDWGCRPNGPAARLGHWLERCGYRGATEVVAVDARLAEHVAAVSGVRARVLFNATDVDAFDRSDVARADPPEVLVPRRLVRKNGVVNAVRAVAASTRDDWVLVVVGDGPEMDALREEAGRLGVAGRVRLAGAVPYTEMPLAVARASVVLIPSVPSEGVEEATSHSALEAMAGGRAVVMSRIGGLAELGARCASIVMVAPGEPQQLADAIDELLGDPVLAAERGAGVQRYVRANHDVKTYFEDVCLTA